MPSKYIGINPETNLNKNLSFLDAAKRGDIQLLKKMLSTLDSEAFLNQKSPTTGKTALILAATEGCYDAVQYLLDNGANVHVKDHGAWKAGKYASYRGKAHIAVNIKRYWFNGRKLLT